MLHIARIMKTIMKLTRVHLRVSLKTRQNSLGALCLYDYAFTFYLLLPSLSVSQLVFLGGSVSKKDGELPSAVKIVNVNEIIQTNSSLPFI